MYRNIHIGKEIEKRIGELKLTKTEFAKKFGTSKQNLNRILEKESIETSLLQRFGEALDYDFFALFTESPTYNIKAENHSGASGSGDVVVVNEDSNKDDNIDYQSLKKEYNSLKKLYDSSENLIKEKERTISFLKLILKQNNIDIDNII